MSRKKLLYDKKSAARSRVSTKTIDRMIASKQLSYQRSGKGDKVLMPLTFVLPPNETLQSPVS